MTVYRLWLEHKCPRTFEVSRFRCGFGGRKRIQNAWVNEIFSNRTIYALGLSCVFDLHDLLSMPHRLLLKNKKLGKKGMKEIIEYLRLRNLSLHK